MKQLLFILINLFTITTDACSQKYYTKNGHISFFSKTSLENIKADNNQVVAVLNTQTGEFQFTLLIKNFYFEKALMEEHFNSDYLESDKFPKAGFKGNISNISDIRFGKDGSYHVNVTGDLDIHGMVRKLTTTGTIVITGGMISASSTFYILLSDYNITIPRSVTDHIAGSIELSVYANLDQKL